MKRPLCAAILLPFLVVASASTALAAKMYWNVDTSDIDRAELDGSDLESILGCSAACTLGPLAIDIVDSKIYFVVHQFDNSIQRAGLNGSNPQMFKDLGPQTTATDLALDSVARDLYFVQVGDEGPDTIIRVALDLSLTEVVLSGLNHPVRGLNVDPAGKIYWTEQDPTLLRRANFDGSNVEDLATGAGVFMDATLDLQSETIYWIHGNNIRRADLDGSNPGVVPAVLSGPNSIAFEPTSGQLYLTLSSDPGQIVRVDPEKIDVVVILSDLLAPSEIAFDSGAASIPMSAGGVPPSLLVGKVGMTEIHLAWPASCENSDDDYAVYEGMLGAVFDTHVSKFCSTGGALGVTFTPAAESSYYVVVPTVGKVAEGSYGQTSLGLRPPSTTPCLSQNSHECSECERDADCSPLEVCQHGTCLVLACLQGCNCCSGGNGLGCDCPECENIVCTTDPFCCDGLWDGLCDAEAAELCDCC